MANNPTITGLSPNTAQQNGAQFELKVTGADFTADSKIHLNGSPLTTTFVSATELKGVVPAAKLTTAGTAKIKIVDSVLSTASAEKDFAITAAPTTPTQPAVQPPRQGTSPWLWAILIVMGLAIIGLIAMLARPSSQAPIDATAAYNAAGTQVAAEANLTATAREEYGLNEPIYTATPPATNTTAPEKLEATEAGQPTNAPATATKIATAINTAAPTLAPTIAPTPAYDLAEDFQQFLDNRGAEMATTVNDGDTPVAYEETASGKAGFAVFGAPASVDPSVVLQAKGADAYGNVFTNTIGLGTEMMFAEPGSILYGPDENPDVVKNNPHGAYISPITQALLESDSASVNVQEGGFAFCTGREMTVQLPSVGVRLDGSDGHNWFLIIRGLFEDGKQDSDLNQTLVFQDYVAGHTQCMMYPPGAYVSEGNFLQVAELSHTGGTNCGKEGCSELSVMMLDLNTQSWAVVYQEQTNAPWVTIGSNWRN